MWIRKMLMNCLLGVLLGLISPVAIAGTEEVSFDELRRLEAQSDPDPAAVRAKRDKGIQRLRGMVRHHRSSEIFLRLAELHEEKAVMEDSPADRVAAATFIKLLIRDFSEVVPREDALYHLGLNKLAVADVAGETLLLRLIDEFPASPHVPFAWLHLGDSAAANGNDAVARERFNQSAKWDFEAGGYALYKLAWVLHREGEAVEAIDTMILAVRRARVSLDPLARATAMEWATEAGQSARVTAALASIRTPTGDCQDDLADRRARLVSTSSVALREHLAVIACLQDAGQEEERLREMRDLVRRYGKYGQWFKQQDHRSKRQIRSALRVSNKALCREARATSPRTRC